MVRIVEAEPLEGLNVQLKLTDGQVIERDLAPLLGGPIFAPIRNDGALFRSLTVVDGTLAWPGELDLCPDMVIWGGPPPAEQEREAS